MARPARFPPAADRDGRPSTAVMIEPAHRTDLAPLLMLAYELRSRPELTAMLFYRERT